MRTYTFYGYFFEGTGKVFSLSDWTFSSFDYYLPHTRDLIDSDFVQFFVDSSFAGMYRVSVRSVGFEQALSILQYSLVQNKLNLVLSCDYDCLSNGNLSKRKIRPSQYRFFDSV